MTILSDEDIYFSFFAAKIDYIRGLTDLKLIWWPNQTEEESTSCGPAEMSVWEANMRRLEALLIDQVTIPKGVYDIEQRSDMDCEYTDAQLTWFRFEKFVNETRKAWA
jgi:hypothetical protein